MYRHQQNSPCTATVVDDESRQAREHSARHPGWGEGMPIPSVLPQHLEIVGLQTISTTTDRESHVVAKPAGPLKEEGHVSHERIRSLRRVGLNGPAVGMCQMRPENLRLKLWEGRRAAELCPWREPRARPRETEVSTICSAICTAMRVGVSTVGTSTNCSADCGSGTREREGDGE